jgi:hypothetical protein
MRIIYHEILCTGKKDRVELYPFYDMHIGKRNCAETPMRKQVGEILNKSKEANRHVRVLFGGDQVNAIKPSDIRRFDFNELADWYFAPDHSGTESQRDYVCRMLNDITEQEISRFVEIFEPIKHLVVGALSGNHEGTMRTRNNVNAQAALCDRLGMVDMTDEAMIVFKFRMKGRGKCSTVVKLYMRHGYGGGRTAGAEPNKLERMRNEWEDADVCLSGHSHTFDIAPPKSVLKVPLRGGVPKQELLYVYRHAANPGCWLYSHKLGEATYESRACYPARPMETLKIVVWPFWTRQTQSGGVRCEVQRPKVELRAYSIL